VRRRRSRPFAVVLAAVAALFIAACDTGDGKQLRPFDPDSTTTSTQVATIDTGTLPSVPIESTPDNPLGVAGTGAEPEAAGFRLFSPWAEGAPIDARHTCDGDDISPAVSWSAPPAGAIEMAVSLVDESAVDGDQPSVHWVVAGIDPAEVSLIEGQVPLGAIQATNSFGTAGWTGPCPPPGEAAHVYLLTVYALNQQSELADGTPADEMLDYIADISAESTELTGTYQR
jgi:Raf kinase inhibitor-like YbhB/YbcL family protein